MLPLLPCGDSLLSLERASYSTYLLPAALQFQLTLTAQGIHVQTMEWFLPVFFIWHSCLGQNRKQEIKLPSQNPMQRRTRAWLKSSYEVYIHCNTKINIFKNIHMLYFSAQLSSYAFSWEHSMINWWHSGLYLTCPLLTGRVLTLRSFHVHAKCKFLCDYSFPGQSACMETFWHHEALSH